jgi:hypothetical protein
MAIFSSKKKITEHMGWFLEHSISLVASLTCFTRRINYGQETTEFEACSMAARQLLG